MDRWEIARIIEDEIKRGIYNNEIGIVTINGKQKIIFQDKWKQRLTEKMNRVI